MKEKLARFMVGRNGNDQLNIFLLGLALVLLVIAAIFKDSFGRITYILVFALLGYAYFRMLSRNLYKRREENAKFLRKADPILRWYRLQRTIRRDKNHVYFKCPSCSQQLRVPRGKGKITVNCRNCGASFQEKS